MPAATSCPRCRSSSCASWWRRSPQIRSATFGQRVGPALFTRPRSRLFNPDHPERARRFFDRYGPKTIVLARFVPIVRTFAPVVAGVGNMDRTTFTTYNLAGGIGWGAGVTALGYFLGQIRAVEDNLEIAVLAVVAVSLIPMAVEIRNHRRAAKVGDEGGSR
ncbi:MAG: VTT domain-containing protein [Acidimicrobiales bacterium]